LREHCGAAVTEEMESWYLLPEFSTSGKFRRYGGMEILREINPMMSTPLKILGNDPLLSPRDLRH